MKKEEKTKQTQMKILQAAVCEFGTQNYDAVSLNVLCKKYQISKGLIYHNFKSKDDLYLQCAKMCVGKITEYLKSCQFSDDAPEQGLKDFMMARQDFFRENPYERNVFYGLLLYPPVHLERETEEITREYREYVKECCGRFLSKVPLRNGITAKMAVGYLSAFQDIYNGYYQNRAWRSEGFSELIEEHDQNAAKLLEIILYGISKEKE